MNKFFDSNNPFWTAMGRVFDVFVLNCLWLVCCLPIFTIGPATTGLFYGMFGIIRGDGGYPSKDFFKSFKQNFKQGIQLGIPLTLIGAFLGLDIYLCYHAGRGIFSFFLFFFLILFIVWLALFLYTFPLLAKFERKNKELLIWAFTLSIQHFLHSFAMIFALIVGLWFCHIIPGLIFIAFGFVAETQTALLAPILAPYLPAPFEIEEDSEQEKTENTSPADLDDESKWLL